MKKSHFVLPALIVAAFAVSGCKNSQSPEDGARSDSHSSQSDKASKQTSGKYCRLLKDDDPSRKGRKVVHRCDGRAVMASEEAKQLLKPDIPVSFAGGGRVIESGLTTRQAANATGRSDEVACQRAFINAAHKFQETAAKRGATRVSNFHSIYDRKPMHGGQYDCEVGTFHARVVFKGDLAR